MHERGKMLEGELYNAEDSVLVNDRLKCKQLCYEFNNTPFTEPEKMSAIIRKILGKTKERFNINPVFFCDYGYNMEIGENFYSNHNLVILDCAKVTFGDNVFIGPNCGFYTAAHPLDAATRNKGLEFAKPIKVGNNVWFGGNVCVMPGVTIGDNCVIGAGSVVTKDIPTNSIAVGNPCKVMKQI